MGWSCARASVAPTLQHLKIDMAPETFSKSTPSRERLEPSLVD